ncbi:MAG: M56 family metallopeptidase [Bacteroidota bacterium]
MTPYILHVAILIGTGYLFYQLFLKKETFFRVNRWLLLAFLPLSFLLPFMEVPEEWSIKEAMVAENDLADNFSSPQPPPEGEKYTYLSPPPAGENFMLTSPPLEGGGGRSPVPNNNETIFTGGDKINSELITLRNSDKNISTKNKSKNNFSIINYFENISWSLVLKYIYLFGVVLFFVRFLFHLSVLLFKICTNKSTRDGIYKIFHLEQDIAPCSFGNCIFINPKKYDQNTYEQILKHEQIHISKFHSLDIILTEILVALQWFNPFAWLYRKAVENNLEYLTDQLMLNKGTDRQAYQLSLLKVSVPHFTPQLVTNYNHSFLKKRIIMMNAKKSPVRSGWKYLLVLPIIGLSIICLNSVESIAKEQLNLLEEPVETTPQNPNETPSEIQEFHDFSEKVVMEEIEVADEETEYENARAEESVEDWSPEKMPSGVLFSIEGKWEAEIEGDRVCMVFRTSTGYGKQFWSSSSDCISKNEFSNLPTNGKGEFTMENDAGVVTFVGSFSGGEGEGSYTFEENGTYREFLSQQGINNLEEETMFFACINKVDRAYLAEVKKMGFEVGKEEFNALAHFGTSLDEVKNYDKKLKGIGYQEFTLIDIAHLDVHNVSIDYINEMHQLGFKDLTIKKMVQAAIHNVTPEYFRELKAAGLEDVKYDDLISFAIHHVEPAYVKEMQNLSARKLTNEEIVQASIHHVTPEYFEELKAAGMDDMSFEKLIQFSIHHISPSYVKEMQNLSSRKLTSEEIVQAGIHNVSADYFENLEEAGMEDMEMEELIQFAIHNISPSYVKDLQSMTSRKLTSEEIIQAGIHHVSPNYFEELKAAGMGDIELQELIQFSIHNISPQYVKEMQNLSSRKLTSEEIIQAGIHHVSTGYFEELKAAGMGDMELKELVQFSIHNVRPQFIADIKKMGYAELSNEEVIQASIHGVTTRYIASLQEVGIKNAPIRKLIEARIHGVDAGFIKEVNARSKGKEMTLDDYIEKKIRGWNRSGRAH